MDQNTKEAAPEPPSPVEVRDWNESRLAHARGEIARRQRHWRKRMGDLKARSLQGIYIGLCALAAWNLMRAVMTQQWGTQAMSFAIATVAALAPFYDGWWSRWARTRRTEEKRYEKNRKVFAKALKKVERRCQGKEWEPGGPPVAHVETAAHNIVQVARSWGWRAAHNYIVESIDRYDRAAGRCQPGETSPEPRWPPIQIFYRYYLDEECEVPGCDAEARGNPLEERAGPPCKNRGDSRCLRRREEERRKAHGL